MVNKRIVDAYDIVFSLGKRLLSDENATQHERIVGRMLLLFSDLVFEEEDVLELDIYLKYFAAKRILDTIDIETILVAKEIGGELNKKPLKKVRKTKRKNKEE